MPERRDGDDRRESDRTERARQEIDRRIEERRRYLSEHAAYWNRKRIAFFAALGCVVLPLATFGVVAIIFVIYAVFLAPPVP